MATLFAWTGALRKRGEIDANNDLVSFADKLEQVSITTIENGIMTKDLAQLAEHPNKKIVGTEDFLSEIKKHLDA